MRMPAVVTKHRRVVIAVAVALVIVGTMVTVAMAQPQQQEQDQDGARARDARMAMMQRGGDQVALAVSGNAVFLFTRNTLYKFDAQTLELLAQTSLPMPERQQRQQQ
ncbi:MAG: hypothetical protein ACOX9R_10375 [Armatimonadota bacterium]|jgi:predicted metal-binding membrane protein